MNDGRNKTSQMGMLNFNKTSAISAYQKLFEQAKESFTRALHNFERDGGKDGPFGAGYAVCRLAILLLRFVNIYFYRFPQNNRHLANII